MPGFWLHAGFNDGTKGTVELSEFLNSAYAGGFAALRMKAFPSGSDLLGRGPRPGELDLGPDAMHRAIKEHGTWIVK